MFEWFKDKEPIPEPSTEASHAASSFSFENEFSRVGEQEALAKQFGLEIYEHIKIDLSPEIYKNVPYAFAKKHVILPFHDNGGTILAAIADPLHLEPLEELRIFLKKPIKGVYCSREVILEAINDCYNVETGAASQLLADMGSTDVEDSDVEVYDLLDTRQQAPLVQLLNLILTEAIQQGASDVHFEPLEDSLRVRYRIDGVLHTRHIPPTEYQAQLLTRIKVMARLDIAERRLPQDGRIKLRMGQREIDFRVSTVPIVNGERIVLRILDKGNITLGLDKLEIPNSDLFRKLIRLPEGIVLVTGPTGSGKTTTLYSALNELYDEQTNIMTIEDPVEYNLKGVAQIGVRPQINLTFASGLRHILRQDPDIIMVGEIRDLETAEIAIQAALTGHLVLSTLHTNDAPSAITRLVDMGIEPYLLSSSIVAVLAQRLVRTICPNCKITYEEDGAALGLSGKQRFQKGAGCEICFESGYQGRHGVYELMEISPAIQQQIVKSPDAVELRKLALKEGMSPLKAHGAALVKQGLTTVEEVLRVIKGSID